MRQALILLPFALGLAACDAPNLNTLDIDDLEPIAAQPGFDDAQGSPDVAFTPVPRIESFDVEPASLPLGGGPVLVSWAAADVAGCALLQDGRPVAQAVAGELLLDVAEPSDLRLLCLDDDQALVAEEQLSVAVVEPPTAWFDPDLSMDITRWETVRAEGSFEVEGEVVEIAVHVPVDGRLVVTPQAGDSRDQVEVWLAADANQDGRLESAEVLSMASTAQGSRIDEELPAGTYSLFVVAVGDEASWAVDVFLGGGGEGSG